MKKYFYLLFILIFISSCNNSDDENNCMSNIDIGLVTLAENSATLKWTETQGFASNYEYGIIGFTLGSGIVGTTTDESVLLENLTPNTEYDFYLQSICGETSTSIFSKYSFKTNDCNGLELENIYPRGFDENDGISIFEINWYPQLLNTNFWEIAMLPTGEVPDEQNIISISTGVTNNQIYAGIPDINPEINYVFHIRRKCNDTFGDWLEKPVLSNELQDFCQFEVSIEEGTESFRIYTSNGTFANALIVEEGQDLETGLIFDSNEIYTYGGNPAAIYNQYSNFFKPNTSYDIYTRIQCGVGYSNYKYVTNYNTPLANAAVVRKLLITGSNLVIEYTSDWGFNANYCRPYTNYTREIEYGIVGFNQGEGTTINITEYVWPEEYIIPLSNFNPNTEYEFTMRTISNSIAGEWNRLCSENTSDPRKIILIP